MTLWFILAYSLGVKAQAPVSIDEYIRALPHRNDLGYYGPGLVCTDTLTVPARGFVEQRYYASGLLGQETVFRDGRRNEIVGTAKRWFSNGQLQSEQTFVNNEREGRLTSFYADGKPRRREHYNAGKSLGGTCWGPDGVPVPCGDYQVAPAYPGGLAALMSDLQHRIAYPKKALHDQWEGKVFVGFIIGADGRLRDAKIVKGVQAELDGEALRVVNSLVGWEPGKLDGTPTDFQFTIPVTFVIQ